MGVFCLGFPSSCSMETKWRSGCIARNLLSRVNECYQCLEYKIIRWYVEVKQIMTLLRRVWSCSMQRKWCEFQMPVGHRTTGNYVNHIITRLVLALDTVPLQPSKSWESFFVAFIPNSHQRAAAAFNRRAQQMLRLTALYLWYQIRK